MTHQDPKCDLDRNCYGVTIPFLCKIHVYLHDHVSWYRAWHHNPLRKHVHIGLLFICLILATALVYSNLIQEPGKAKAVSSYVPESTANIVVLDVTVPDAWDNGSFTADTEKQAGSNTYWQGDALNSITALGGTSGVGYKDAGAAGFQGGGTEAVVRDLDADSVYTSAADILKKAGSGGLSVGNILNSFTALGSTTGVGYKEDGTGGFQGTEAVVRDLDADSVYTSAADTAVDCNGSTDGTIGACEAISAGATLVSVTAGIEASGKSICTNNLNGTAKTCIRTASTCGGAGTLLVGANCGGTNTEVNGEWAFKDTDNDGKYDDGEDIYIENVSGKLTYSASADTDVYSTGGLSVGNALTNFASDCDNGGAGTKTCKFSGTAPIDSTESIVVDEGGSGTYSTGADTDVYSTGGVANGAALTNFAADCNGGDSGTQACKYTGSAPIDSADSILVDEGTKGGAAPNNVVDKRADRLTGIVVKNLGTAVNATEISPDISAVKLWADDGDDVFESSEDTLLSTSMTILSSTKWREVGLLQAIPADGQRIYVTANISATPTDGRTLNFQVDLYSDANSSKTPDESGDAGYFVSSNNQEPTSNVTSADIFTIDSAAPTGLGSFSAPSNTSSSQDLSWSAATDPNFDHYEIWYGTNQSDVQNRTGSAALWDDSNDAALATAGTTSTTITGLAPSTLYYYKIWAIDSFGHEATVADINATTAAATTQCSDSIDNDSDGWVDYPADPGCSNGADNDESNGTITDCSDNTDNDGDTFTDGNDPKCSASTDVTETAACQDSTDNDGDGWTDYPADPGCSSANDDDESNGVVTDCADGSDNDSDTFTDGNDPGCSSAADTSELNPAVACDDGSDNDGDTSTDYPDDTGCSSAADTSELDPGVACDDDSDNDSDTFVDYPSDPGCSSATDTDEFDATPACSNGGDDDGDGWVDYPADPGCSSAGDTDETNTATSDCDDGIDNDGDGLADGNDPGCSSAADISELNPAVACDDGSDNDGDGFTDYPSDPGCSSVTDTTETNATVACDDDSDNDGDGSTDYPDDPGCSSAADTSELNPAVACDDGSDNDGDTSTDYPDDTGCSSAADTSELDPGVACDDDSDNDSDTFTDYPDDPGCSSATDTDEFNVTLTDCSDSTDNDTDGVTDLADPGCVNAADDDESDGTTECQDATDNDFDGATDFPADFSCSSATDNDESSPSAECQDGLDNDLNLDIDFPADSGCSSAQDDDESSVAPPPLAACEDSTDNDGDGLIDFPADPGCTSGADTDETNPGPQIISSGSFMSPFFLQQQQQQQLALQQLLARFNQPLTQPAFTYVFPTTLKFKGPNNPENDPDGVKVLQRTLHLLYPNSFPEKWITGIFGNRTIDAVCRFQRERNLVPLGYRGCGFTVGSATRNALFEALRATISR